MRPPIWLGFFALLGVAACSDSASQQPSAAAAAAAEVVPVLADKATVRNLPVEINEIGSVQPYATISIKPQVGGQITQVQFVEGQEVKKDDPLFTIDPRPYQTALEQALVDKDKADAQLKQAEANRARDEAMARKANADVKRYVGIPEEAAIAQETVEQVQATAQAMEATVASDVAAIDTARQTINGANSEIENAKVQLSYCTIAAPLTGRTGSLMVNQGNIVKANPDNPLVTINQIQPIYVTFTAPEQYLNDVRRQSANGSLQVAATVQGDNSPVTGTLTFIDNQVDRGTIMFKATFANADRRLWPGQFADVKLRLAERPNALTIPSAAILNGQQGTYVYVITGDQTVINRPVKTGITYENLTEITDGLHDGEQVVTDGQVRLRPGVKVEIKAGLQQATLAVLATTDKAPGSH